MLLNNSSINYLNVKIFVDWDKMTIELHRAPRSSVRMNAEVEEARAEGKPVVVLESNVICNGLPKPLNLDSARQVEAMVRSMGAVPATTAVIAGQFVVGLTSAELESLAKSDDVVKVTSRDLALVQYSGGIGGTSISATMLIAEYAGFDIVASAGLGGVHRGAENTWDVSSDLIQLTRSSVLMVCAGVKSILDIPKTLEYLETHCIPVVGLAVDDFPGFYTLSSGSRCPARLETAVDVAETWTLHHAALPGAMLVAQPLPKELALPQQVIDTALELALVEVREAGITGPGVTKYLTRSIDRVTEGRASRVNADVLIHTARIAAEIAVARGGAR